MKIKISELTGDALAYTVAKLEGRDMYFDENGEGPWFRDSDTHKDGWATDYSSWEVCGPIIERERIDLDHREVLVQAGKWVDRIGGEELLLFIDGPTALIAAMRLYVLSKLGEEVDIPKELA